MVWLPIALAGLLVAATVGFIIRNANRAASQGLDTEEGSRG